MPQPIATSSIVAQAFRFMELSPISSFGDDSEQALAASEQYPLAIEYCLEQAEWSFALVLVDLPQATPADTLAVDPDLPYVYEYPADMLRLTRVGDGCVRYRQERDYLRADQAAPLPIRYVARITNEAALPVTFREAVSLKLALLLGPRWTQTASKLADLEAMFRRTIDMAARNDARSGSPARYDGLPDQGDWATDATLGGRYRW